MNYYHIEVGFDMEREQEISDLTKDELATVLNRVLQGYGDLPNGVEVEVNEL